MKKLDGKRLGFAAILIVASGAGMGFVLRPGPSSDAPMADDARAPKTEYAHYSGPVLKSPLPPALLSAAANRPDCFYLRVAYARSLHPGPMAAQTAQLRQRGQDAGCWIAD